jgi:hypothetical protein
MQKIILLITIAMLVACDERSGNEPDVPIQQLIDSVEINGDVKAFHKLETASMDYAPGTFITTFKIMADEYNNAFACMSVYYAMAYMNGAPSIANSDNGIFQLDSLNTPKRDSVIMYLLKADSLGNKEAKDHVQEYKKVGLIN